MIVVLSFFLPIHGVILAVGLSIIADTIMGMLKACKIKEPITSRKLSVVVSKMILYQSALILFFIIEKYILTDFVGLFTSLEFIVTKLVAITLISIEVKSIDENFKAIKGYSLWDKFKFMLLRAKEIKSDLEEVKKD